MVGLEVELTCVEDVQTLVKRGLPSSDVHPELQCWARYEYHCTSAEAGALICGAKAVTLKKMEKEFDVQIRMSKQPGATICHLYIVGEKPSGIPLLEDNSARSLLFSMNLAFRIFGFSLDFAKRLAVRQ